MFPAPVHSGTGNPVSHSASIPPTPVHHTPVRLPYLLFGLWRVRFPPVLVRTGRRLPVQALGERRVLVSVTGYPRVPLHHLRAFSLLVPRGPFANPYITSLP